MSVRRAIEDRGERIFRRFVARSDDRRLERIAGSRPGLRVIFLAMQSRYVPGKSGGFVGDIQWDLRTTSGEVRSWTVTVTPERARARAGRSADPKLTIKVGVGDFMRVAAGELNPVQAVLTGRLDLSGDFGVAMRLGEMFGIRL